MTTYINIVLELNAPGTVELDTLQSLSYDVVWLPLRLLGRFDHGGFVEVATIVHVEFQESILESENLALVQLRKAPMEIKIHTWSVYAIGELEKRGEVDSGNHSLLQLEGVHLEMEGARGRRAGPEFWDGRRCEEGRGQGESLGYRSENRAE
jgi:hypothetical protein